MASLRALFSKFSSQMDLVLAGVMLSFCLFMVREVEPVLDLAYHGNFVYMALGKQGVRVLDVVTNPDEPPFEVGMYNTYGSAEAIAIHAADDKVNILVADNKKGVGVFEVSSQGELTHRWHDSDIKPALDIAIQEEFAFVARGKKGLTIFKADVGKPKDNHIWSVEGFPTAARVLVKDKKAYVLDNDWMLYVVKLNEGHPDKSTISQPYPVGAPVNDFEIHAGKAYLATEGAGLVIIDTNQQPEKAILGKYEDLKNVRGVHIEENFGFISAGTEGIQALEISQPGAIVSVGSFKEVQTGWVPPKKNEITDSDATEGEPIIRSINAQRLVGAAGKLYYADGFSGLRTLEPQQNIDVKVADVFGGIDSQEHWAEDVVVIHKKGESDDDPRKSFAFMAGGDRGLWVIDATQVGKPDDILYQITPIGDGYKPLSGYTNAVTAFKDHIYLSHKDKGVQILDASNPRALQAYPPIALKGETHDLALPDGKTLFVAAGDNGLRVIDIQDKNNAKLIDTEGAAGKSVGIFLSGDYAYLAAGEAGLHILDVDDVTKPTRITTHDTEGDARAVVVHTYRENEDSAREKVAYVANGGAGLAVVSVTDPKNPATIQNIPFSGEVQDVFIREDKLFVTESGEGLFIFDITTPRGPEIISKLDTPGWARRLYVDEDYAFIADQNWGLRIIEIKDPKLPGDAGHFDMPTRVKDLVITEDQKLAYLVGDSAGMWTVDLSNPRNPVPVNLLEIKGQPTSIELGSDGRAYLGDGSQGFHVASVGFDPENKVQPTRLATYPDLSDVRRVVVDEGFAYVANGDGSLPVVSVLDLKEIKAKKGFNTQGSAINIGIAGDYLYVVTSVGKVDIGFIQEPGTVDWKRPNTEMASMLGNTFNVDLHTGREFAYVSDGSNGLVVFNVNKPINPIKVGIWDTPGTLKDAAVTRYYIFMADGENGVDMVYTPGWWAFNPQINAYYNFDPGDEKGPVNCVPNAQSIKAISRVLKEDKVEGERKKLPHHYAYVATDQCGLVTLDYTVTVGFKPLGLYETPGEAGLIMVLRGGVRVVGEILKSAWTGDISLKEAPSLAVRTAKGQALALDKRVQDTALLFLFGLIFLTVGIFAWLAFFPSFALPVRSFPERLMSYIRLVLYFREMHGPLVLVREGKVTTRQTESRGVSLALVDLNSAITIEEFPQRGLATILRRGIFKSRQRAGESPLQVRVAGPGMVFLQDFERVKAGVDLRRQIRLRLEVKVQTRDGLEVGSHVFTGFTLGEKPEVLKVTYDGPAIPENLREVAIRDAWIPIPGRPDKERQVERVSGLMDSLDPDDQREIHNFIQQYIQDDSVDGTQNGNGYQGTFDFDSERIFKAAVSRPYDVGDQKYKEWTDLPAHIAAGVFRDLISQETYDNLFKPTDPQDFPVRDLKSKFAAKMRNQGILSYQYVTNKNGEPILEDQVWEEDQVHITPPQVLKNPKPLRARGIKLIFSGFTQLKTANQEVSSYLTHYWQSEWQKEAEIARSDYKLQATRLVNQARTEAEIDLVNTLSMIFGQGTRTREALAYRVLQALESVASDPNAKNLLPRDTIRMLARIQRILLPGEGGVNIDPDDL